MKRWQRLRTILKVLVVFIVADVLFAQAAWQWAPFVFESEHRKKYRVPHPVYHHSFRPNSAVMAKWGGIYYPFYSNSLGFKDRAVREVPLASEKYRLVFIGDSFAEGQGIPYPETFVGLIDEQLKSRGVEVLNAAVSSYSPVFYYLKTRHLLETVKLDMDEVVVFMDVGDIYSEANDYALADGKTITKTYQVEKDPYKGLRVFLRDNSLVLTFLYRLRDAAIYWWGFLRHQVQPDEYSVDHGARFAGMLNKLGGDWTYNPQALSAWGKKGLKNATTHMNLLHTMLSEKGIRMRLAVFPWPDHLLRKDRDSLQVRYWREWSAEKGVPFIDLFDAFMSQGSAEEVIETLFIPHDHHWNEAGHVLVAEKVMEGWSLPGTPGSLPGN